MILVPYINNNPTVAPAKDGNQAVTVYDRNIGNKRTVIAPKEDVDAFLAARQDANKDALLKSRGKIAQGAVASGAVVAALSSAFDAVSSNKLNNLVKKLNPVYKEAYDKALQEHEKSVWRDRPMDKTTVVREVLDKKPFKNKYFDLKDLFSEEANNFNKVKVLKKALKSGGIGLAAGAAVGLIFGALVYPALTVEKADAKLTDEFIKAHN